MGLRDKWNGLTKQGKREAYDKIRHHGWSPFAAIFVEHIKDIICAILMLFLIQLEGQLLEVLRAKNVQ